ncbi:sterol desaturase family protein [Acidobacteria bacterium AH-259-L09]|nr:sterol desaturase family protein [Acidobacteria bacterium AH-259-L09]
MALDRFASFWIYPSLACFLLYLSSVSGEDLKWNTLLWLVPIGLLMWSLLEYVLHRFFFHWTLQNPKMRRILQQLHLSHHGDPRNPDKILVRPIYSLPVSALLLGALYVLAGFFAAVGLLIGIWLGFLYYESVHYRLHLSISSNGLLRYQRRRHFYHHFVDDDNCFGVTSPLWDLLFGTYRRIR